MEYLFVVEIYLAGSFSSSSESATEGEQESLRITKCLVTTCGFLLCYSIISPFWWFLTIQYNACLDGNHAWLFGLNKLVLLKSGVSLNWWPPVHGLSPWTTHMDYPKMNYPAEV